MHYKKRWNYIGHRLQVKDDTDNHDDCYRSDKHVNQLTAQWVVSKLLWYIVTLFPTVTVRNVVTLFPTITVRNAVTLFSTVAVRNAVTLFKTVTVHNTVTIFPTVTVRII